MMVARRDFIGLNWRENYSSVPMAIVVCSSSSRGGAIDSVSHLSGKDFVLKAQQHFSSNAS